MRIRHAVFVGFCVLLAGLALATRTWLSGGPLATNARPAAATVRVTKERFVSTLLVSGELAAVRAIRISVPTLRGLGPFAIKAMAPEGSYVQPGEILAEIDNSILVSALQTEELNLEKADNDLVTKQAQLEVQIKDLEIQLDQNKLEQEKAQLKAEIDRELLALRDWQDYQFAFQKAKKEYEKTSKSLELVEKAAQEEITTLRLRREQIAGRIERLKSDIAALDIRGDHPGTVLYEIYPPSRWSGDTPRKYQVGDMVSFGNMIMTLPDLKTMEVRAAVSEVDGGLLRLGQRVRIVADAHPGMEFAGALEHIPELAESVGRATNIRAFMTTIQLDRTDTKIMRPGMSVRIEIILSEEDGLVLPRNAVSEENGKFYIQPARGVRTEVQVRARNPFWCLVEGLPEGTEVRI